MTPALRKHEQVALRIDSLAYGGNGVARVDGLVTFVRGGLPGDLVRARVTKVKRDYAEATTLEVLEASPDRVAAPCTHVGACGGCRLQELAYPAQAAAKAVQLRDALVRLGGIQEPTLEPIVPAESAFGYRNKFEFSFAPAPSGVALGFHRSGRWDEVLDVQRCWIGSDLSNAIRDSVRAWASEQGIPAYDQRTGVGYLRHLVVREARNTGQALAVLVTAPGELPARDALVEALRVLDPVRAIHWAVNDRPAEVTNLPTQTVWGADAIDEELLGLRFTVGPNAFLQTNTRMAERLYEVVREYAALTGNETVFDLYAGIGTIGLTLARDALTVWGVESSTESASCAVDNARRNGIRNAAYFQGEVGEALAELVPRSGSPDVVVVDPPRPGLTPKTLAKVAALGARRLVYVSCNPATLAGNARALVTGLGYRLVRARAVDMFPHTPHVESVSLFERND